MSELSLMIALRAPTVRERMEFAYRSHAEDAATIYKWNGANGLYALHSHDVIRLRREFVPLQSVNDYWFQGVERRLGAALGVRRSSSFKFPLPCGKSMANTLAFPEVGSGSETDTASACMTSRMFAAIARKTSRRSRLDVIRVVRFRSSCSRSF